MTTLSSRRGTFKEKIHQKESQNNFSKQKTIIASQLHTDVTFAPATVLTALLKDKFLERIGYYNIRVYGIDEFSWSESVENHRQQRYLGIITNSKALSWSGSLKSSILILNCNETTDGIESPMSAFAWYQSQALDYFCIVVNFWGYNNPGLTPRDILVWLIGEIVEEGKNSDLTLPLDEADPDLICVLRQLILSLLREHQIVVVLDGLAYFESESSSEDDEVKSDRKSNAGSKSNAGKKSEPQQEIGAQQEDKRQQQES